MIVESNTATSAIAAGRKTSLDSASVQERSDIADRLGNLAESAAHSRKAFAEERLKQLKEQMNKLMLFDMAPGAMAGQSALLANELKSAASEFASSFEALAGMEPPADEGMSLAQQAYLGFDYAGETEPSALSQADHETASSFVNAAKQITSLAERASEKSGGTDGSSATSTRDTAFGIIEMMARLGSAPTKQSFYW